jgi:collagen type V/XI/XXIV/XXVII alpha
MFQITYETIGVVQMTFLRLLSQEAYQNFTYTCINSAAWFNLKTNNHDMAIKLLGENETEFSAEGIRPSVLVDGCKVSQFGQKWKGVPQTAICTFSKTIII